MKACIIIFFSGHHSLDSLVGLSVPVLSSNSTEAPTLAILFTGFGEFSWAGDAIVTVIMFHSHSCLFIEPVLKLSLCSYGLSSTQIYFISNVNVSWGSVTKQGAPVKRLVSDFCLCQIGKQPGFLTTYWSIDTKSWVWYLSWEIAPSASFITFDLVGLDVCRLAFDYSHDLHFKIS